VVFNDPRLPLSDFVKIVLVLTSIFPFCATLGYLTPSLIDHYANGRPREAGTAYAINIMGCILGPIVASYVLLPTIGVRLAMILLALVFVVYSLLMFRDNPRPMAQRYVAASLTLAMFIYSLAFATSYEDGSYNKNNVVRRDYAATVISTGTGKDSQLLVNGIGMTVLIPITKVMAHLPLAVLPRHPEAALVICFGMGTTYRSMMSWDIDVTGIELIPSVRDAFSYYFDDADEILKRPNGRIVIDDGRRYLKRTATKFDMITIDPPPPVEAAGSSLLYSRQFYDLAIIRLKAGGIVQQWLPIGEARIARAVARSLREAFPHVRVFGSTAGWGFHFLASMQPISVPTPDEFVERMPARARIDLVEWSNHKDPRTDAKDILSREIPLDIFLEESATYSITDDQPYNEYFLLRRLWARLNR
jgi:spermidine synthase